MSDHRMKTCPTIGDAFKAALDLLKIVDEGVLVFRAAYVDGSFNFVVWVEGAGPSRLDALLHLAAEFYLGEMFKRHELPPLTGRRPENSDGHVTPFRAQERVTRGGAYWYVVDWYGDPVANCGWGERGKAVAQRFAALWNRNEGIPNSMLGMDENYRNW